MTIITVTSNEQWLTQNQRSELAKTLTDAVLVPETGKSDEAARAGFQVHFVELPDTHIAIGGKLLPHSVTDAAVVDVAVMDADWGIDVRREVIDRTLSALANANGVERPGADWWVNFRVIEEGSWGAYGSVISILSLLEAGVFSKEKKEKVLAKFRSP